MTKRSQNRRWILLFAVVALLVPIAGCATSHSSNTIEDFLGQPRTHEGLLSQSPSLPEKRGDSPFS